MKAANPGEGLQVPQTRVEAVEAVRSEGLLNRLKRAVPAGEV